MGELSIFGLWGSDFQQQFLNWKITQLKPPSLLSDNQTRFHNRGFAHKSASADLSGHWLLEAISLFLSTGKYAMWYGQWTSKLCKRAVWDMHKEIKWNQNEINKIKNMLAYLPSPPNQTPATRPSWFGGGPPHPPPRATAPLPRGRLSQPASRRFAVVCTALLVFKFEGGGDR